MPIPNSTASVTAMATRYAGYSLAKRDTAKSASPVVRSSVRRITNPLMTKEKVYTKVPVDSGAEAQRRGMRRTRVVEPPGEMKQHDRNGGNAPQRIDTAEAAGVRCLHATDVPCCSVFCKNGTVYCGKGKQFFFEKKTKTHLLIWGRRR